VRKSKREIDTKSEGGSRRDIGEGERIQTRLEDLVELERPS
jgi:hypothetical protein